ncbi:MAG: hypothetical protein AAF202_03720, partial [Pseudomonadota bacterium]
DSSYLLTPKLPAKRGNLDIALLCSDRIIMADPNRGQVAEAPRSFLLIKNFKYLGRVLSS